MINALKGKPVPVISYWNLVWLVPCAFIEISGWLAEGISGVFIGGFMKSFKDVLEGYWHKELGMNNLTDAQNRALDWLPKDGTWRLKPGRLTTALSSLSHRWPNCVECEWGDFGPCGGRYVRWRLNARGVEKVRELGL